MSLFSLVQGRIPPPSMPAPVMPAAVAPQQPMVQQPPMPGLAEGGMMSMHDKMHKDMDRDDKMNRMEEMMTKVHGMLQGGQASIPSIPGAKLGLDTEDNGWQPYKPTTPSPADGLPRTGDVQIDGAVVDYMTEHPGTTYSDALRSATAAVEWARQGRADSLSGRTGPGPDHFYEQQAEEARQFEENLKMEKMQTEDARRIAEYNAAAAKEQAAQEWYNAQLAAQQKARDTQVQAGSQAQNSFLQGLRQGDPDQGDIYFAPSLLYEDTKNAYNKQQTQTPQPNMPGISF